MLLAEGIKGRLVLIRLSIALHKDIRRLLVFLSLLCGWELLEDQRIYRAVLERTLNSFLSVLFRQVEILLRCKFSVCFCLRDVKRINRP